MVIILQKLVVVFITIVMSQSQLNLSVLYLFTIVESPVKHNSISHEKVGGGTINTEIDMRGNLRLNVNTNTPTAFITEVIVESSNGRKIVLKGCIAQKCSYNIEYLPTNIFYTVTTITDMGWSFSDSFQRE